MGTLTYSVSFVVDIPRYAPSRSRASFTSCRGRRMSALRSVRWRQARRFIRGDRIMIVSSELATTASNKVGVHQLIG